VDEHEITYFIKEPPGKIILEQKNLLPGKTFDSNEHANNPISAGKYPNDYENLQLHISSLETQIAEQAKLSREQIDVLLEDRKTRGEEFETQRVKDAQIIKQLREKLFKSQQLLHESTKDFLELKFSTRQNERRWMHEKDKLLQELDKSSKHENINNDEVLFFNQIRS